MRKERGSVSSRLKVGMAALPLVAVVLAGCSGGHEGHGGSSAGGGSAAASQPAASAGAGGAGATGGAATAGSSAGTFNQQDVTFAQNMIMHHRQALDLARLAPGRAQDAQVKRLASSVQASQAPEIDLMSRWLGAWGAEVPEDMSSMDMAGSMPGMQSLKDMRALADLKGQEFDQRFLQMMKDHHEGAITMAKEQLTKGSDAEAKNLASQVIVEQGAEIDLIDNLLK